MDFAVVLSVSSFDADSKRQFQEMRQSVIL
jgi:hypothetical protein